MVEKTRNGGTWSDAQFTSFVKSALRGARWGPKYECIRKAKVGYALYKCALCGTVGPPTLAAPEGKKNRVKNAVADHIDPVVDPSEGFTTWDNFIERLYVEVEGFQCLCNTCHSKKTKEENEVRKVTRSQQKEEQ